ncbi:flagellin [Clostridium sp. DJ247]|uniref:flagellin N-terminal helical domain-containing protein n=1 Tax=Clostridium sp. DJ247 TaxID=2726188 RepID=UPI001628040B|nr:flagellin [Clostridium sp. DJ247]MBC2582122.1 flagellin [Clostridium sp. DJ247]
MRLNHNMASLNIFRASSKALKNQSAALERISSGYKINNAKDGPAVIAQSERMRMQIRGLQMAGRNSQDGISMLQTAEGGLDSMTNMLQRIRELVVQSGSGSNTVEDRKTIQNEIDQMIDGMDSIANNTEFNGKKLLYEDRELQMPIGANPGESVTIQQKNLTSSNIKTTDGKALYQIKSGELYNITDANNLDNALGIVDNALNTIVSFRSKYGALENRFESSFQDINEMADKMEGADSNLRDADIAQEMMEFAKDNILSEAGNAMMVQSNKIPQDVLRILENVRSK